MTNEERERAIDFILTQQADNSAQLGRLIEAHRTAENRLTLSEQRLERSKFRLDRYERLLRLMIRAGRRERALRREQDDRYDRRYRELLASQVHTDDRLDALVSIVQQRMNGV